MKQYIPNSQTLEAITKHGATSMLWVIDEDIDETRIGWSIGVIKANLPLQVDDEFYFADGDGCRLIRLLYFTTLSVEVKRVQELSNGEKYSLIGYVFSADFTFEDWLKEQNIDYNSNPLVGLINFKEKE